MGKVTSPRGGTTRGLSSDILDRDRSSILCSPSYPALSSKRAKTKREGNARSLWKNLSSAIRKGYHDSGDLASKIAAPNVPQAGVDPAQLRASGGQREESSESENEVREDADRKETPEK